MENEQIEQQQEEVQEQVEAQAQAPEEQEQEVHHQIEQEQEQQQQQQQEEAQQEEGHKEQLEQDGAMKEEEEQQKQVEQIAGAEAEVEEQVHAEVEAEPELEAGGVSQAEPVEEKGPFEEIIQECKENTVKLETILIQKELEYQDLSRILSDLQEEIWNQQKEEYEQNSVRVEVSVRNELESMQKQLADKEAKITEYEAEIASRTVEGELVRMRAKLKETQQHKDIHIHRQYKAAMAGEQEILPALRLQAEQLKHELDSKKGYKERLDEEIKHSELSIKELRRLKREGASQEHELQEQIEKLSQR